MRSRTRVLAPGAEVQPGAEVHGVKADGPDSSSLRLVPVLSLLMPNSLLTTMLPTGNFPHMLLTSNSHRQDRRLKVLSQVSHSPEQHGMYLRTSTSILAAFFTLVLAGCSHSRAQSSVAAPPPPAVTVAEVIARPLHHWDELTGELQAVNTVDVHPRVSGFVDSVQFTEGARVAKGQVLFQIDPRPFEIEIERLSAELKRAQSKLDFATAGHARAERS